jgi:DNA polymerase-3 subunit gamma/tau
MSVYIPLATKYRPQRFADVIGQDIAIKIITRGIQKNRIGSAILFSGTRGIGKTTIARIMAKTLRCEKRDANDPEPCCKCPSCLEFTHDNQIDVVEIDAASNTSVDDIREIIESCRYKPTSGYFKVFIIDEVHMLSKSAFNALLKTLEEPPEHVKFLLATTETYKVPETILSRVLKFDLKKVEVNLVAQYLSSICNQENIVANAVVLSIIAKAGEGSIRDCLSILDQAINMAENNEITVGDIKEMLCVSSDDDIVELLRLILSTNTKNAIIKYRDIAKSDISSHKIINSLMNNVYVLTCLKTNIDPVPNTVSDDLIPHLTAIAQNVSLPALSRIWQMLLKGAEELGISDHPEVVLEMIIVRITYASSLPDLREIIENYGEIKDKLCLEDKKKNISQNSPNTSLLEEAVTMFPNAKIQ